MPEAEEKHLAALSVQSKHRRRLSEHWKIAPGSNVLEIGCGQGEMTAELAEVVGSKGHIQAVDIASPEYGAPLTLRQATDILSASAIGPLIDFRFEFDILDPDNEFQPDQFDYVVFAHSSWYFSAPNQLLDTLKAVRPWAKYLRFAEWDMKPSSFEQFPHLLSILIQGQIEAFKTESDANVRTPASKSQIKSALNAAGWLVTSEETIDASELQDADWEVNGCLRSAPQDMEAIELPTKLVPLLESQLELLREIGVKKGNRPLNAYSLSAERPD